MSDTGQETPANQILIYACSGCSDVGELADRTARVLSQKHIGEMSCLAGIGGRVKPLVRKAQKAGAIMAIDGCPLNCARHTLSAAGFETKHHLQLQLLGFRKGDCPPTEERLAMAVQAGMQLIQSIEQNKEVIK